VRAAGPRAGITVSGKVGGACVRNRAKRRIRVALRQALKENPVNADLVFIALARIKSAAFDDICKDAKALLTRVKT
jgi:ribonuclease P protein component